MYTPTHNCLTPEASMGNRDNGIGAGALKGHEANASDEKRNGVRLQLEAVLADQLFSRSKRCTDFLRFTVERALDKTTGAIKERTLGIEVFGRKPDYDTNVDPVVRATAAEVRKRLHQYYHTFGRGNEIRIEFPRGSYVPEFHFPENGSLQEATASGSVKQGQRQPGVTKRWLFPLLIAAPYVALCVFLLGSTSQSTLDRFWSPIRNSEQATTFCIPTRSPATDPTEPASAGGPEALAKALRVMGRPSRVAFSDSIAVTRIAGMLQGKEQRFQFRGSSDTTLEDLKGGPAVLVGIFGNRWTQQFQGGRFTFTRDGPFHYISDNRNPSSRAWSIQDGDVQLSTDYGIISRTSNPTTGTYVVAVAGIHGFGTEAAGECAADPVCLDSAAKLAPGDWKRANIEIVVQTTVIDDSPGVPKVLAAYLW